MNKLDQTFDKYDDAFKLAQLYCFNLKLNDEEK